MCLSPLPQSFANPDQRSRNRPDIEPLSLPIAIGNVEAQRGGMGIDHDFRSATGSGHLFRKLEKNRSVAISLEIFADRNEPKTRLLGANEIDAYSSYRFIIAEQKVRKVGRLELVFVMLVVGLSRKQKVEDRLAANGMVRLPFLRGSNRPQRITFARVGHPSNPSKIAGRKDPASNAARLFYPLSRIGQHRRRRLSPCNRRW
jgi:hypothetical protein